MPILRIGNAQGFWGDDPHAPARLAAQAHDLDYLTLDYLAEVSMSILAKQRERDPLAGYPRDFLNVIHSLTPLWQSGRRLRVVTNAGGLNPNGCGQAVAAILREAGCLHLKVGIVSGDDVLPLLRETHARDLSAFSHLETREPLSSVHSRLVTANAYLGATPLVEALRAGADIVITGRVADPSLTVAPCVAHFGWAPDDYGRLAGATIAGHLIECGTQVTGGISTDWLELPTEDIGFPIAEVSPDGSCVINKPSGTGGRVSERTVKEQLLYEIGDPDNYLSPDATVSFLSLRVNDEGSDRVAVSGAVGRPPPSTYKVSATYRAGFRATGTLAIFGRDAVTKAERAAHIIRERLRRDRKEPAGWNVECLGSGDIAGGTLPRRTDLVETVLRIAVWDADKRVVEQFAQEMVPLVTSGPQGTTGYAQGRPPVREVFGYWPTLIDRGQVHPRVEML